MSSCDMISDFFPFFVFFFFFNDTATTEIYTLSLHDALPICPLLSDAGLFAFIIPSPKRGDLRRDGAFAMHSFPCPDNEDAFYLTGRARPVTSPDVREVLATQFVQERS